MGRARTWKLAGAGAAVAALGLGGVTALGGAPSSASTAHDRPPTSGPRGQGPADQGPPGLSEGTALIVGGSTASPSSGTTLNLSSYDFAATATGTGTAATGTATGAGATGTASSGIAPGTLVVTTSLAAQSDLSSLSSTTAELVVRGGRGPSSVDAAFTGLTLQQYEMSSAGGGTLTLTFTFTKVALAAPTPPPPANGSSSNSNGG